MSDSLFSPSWYRVADLKPRLRQHARIHRHLYRGQRWYILQDPSSGRYHRFSPAAHHIIALMDGARTMQQCWETAAQQLGDGAPTQDETIQLLGQLHAADVLQCDVAPDTEELFERHEKHQRAQWKRRLWNPLSLRFPLIDPERFLSRWVGVVQPLFGWIGGCVWLLVVAAALVLAGVHWDALTENVMDQTFAPHNLLLLFLAYPVVKALHELGHAFATKVWGGEVHEMGIVLLVLMPIPYVDASSASAFREKWRRVVVGAAGILVELFLASCALFVWLNVEPGIVRSIAFNVMLIGGVSTVFFNGNPLLRFDGYYILADALEIPNLGARSTQYLKYLLQRYLFGVSDAKSPVNAPGEGVWFVVYGVASFVYRLFVMVVIALFIAGKFFFVGVLLAAWAVLTQLLLPILKAIHFVFTSPTIRRHRLRAVCASATALASLAALVFMFPVPLSTQAQGVVWLPEHAYVRAGADGFVRAVLAKPNATVMRGQPLFESHDPILLARVKVLESQLRELDARYTASRSTDRVEAEVIKEEMASVEADLARARERVEALVIRSPADGTFVVPDARDLPNRFVGHGDLLAYVTDFANVTARVVVPQSDIGLVRSRTVRVDVRLANQISKSVSAAVKREVPGATDQLPSPALGSAGGGELAVDPSDEDGQRALEKVFQFELALDTPVRTVGGRVYVRFDHGNEPLAERLYRRGRQLFLRRFDV